MSLSVSVCFAVSVSGYWYQYQCVSLCQFRGSRVISALCKCQYQSFCQSQCVPLCQSQNISVVSGLCHYSCVLLSVLSHWRPCTMSLSLCQCQSISVVSALCQFFSVYYCVSVIYSMLMSVSVCVTVSLSGC